MWGFSVATDPDCKEWEIFLLDERRFTIGTDFDAKKDAQRVAVYMNGAYLTKKLGLIVYRVAPVTITVAFWPPSRNVPPAPPNLYGPALAAAIAAIAPALAAAAVPGLNAASTS
jgi:hypothetical protein